MTRFAMPALAIRAARVATSLRLTDHVDPPYNVVIRTCPARGPRSTSPAPRCFGYFPVSVVTDGQGLNITVQSYRDNLDIGLVSRREPVPDLWDLLGHLTGSIDELAARAAEHTGPPA